MTIIFTTILTLHRVNGDSPPPSLIFNQLVLLIHLVHNISKIHTHNHQFKIKNHQSLEMMEMSMHESKQQSQNRKPSILEMIMRKSKQQSQNLTDSQFHHEFHNNTSSFQVQSQQNDEPIDYKKILEAMTQARFARDHEIDMMVQTLRSHHSAISDVANHSVRAEESCCIGK